VSFSPGGGGFEEVVCCVELSNGGDGDFGEGWGGGGLGGGGVANCLP
jgi:hypothetical protein